MKSQKYQNGSTYENSIDEELREKFKRQQRNIKPRRKQAVKEERDKMTDYLVDMIFYKSDSRIILEADQEGDITERIRTGRRTRVVKGSFFLRLDAVDHWSIHCKFGYISSP